MVTQEKAQSESKRSFWQRIPVIVIGTFALFGLLFFGLGYLAQSLTHEWTDDAFLDANIVAVAPKVAGQVKLPLPNALLPITSDLAGRTVSARLTTRL